MKMYEAYRNFTCAKRFLGVFINYYYKLLYFRITQVLPVYKNMIQTHSFN